MIVEFPRESPLFTQNHRNKKIIAMVPAQSQWRSHASTLDSLKSRNTDVTMTGAKLSNLLSKSLLDLLTSSSERITPVASDGSDQSQVVDVYHNFLNSLSNVTPQNTSSIESVNKLKETFEKWVFSSMAMVGVGSISNTLKFWKEFGNGNEESFTDSRYLVWFAKEILLGLATEEFMANEHNDALNDEGMNSVEKKFRDHVMEVLDHWHQSSSELLSRNGAKTGSPHPLGKGYSPIEEEDADTAGVMWQMLLENAHLTPLTLRDAYEKFSSPHHRYERNSLSLGEKDENNPPQADYFAWPTFLRCAAYEANRREIGGASHSLKRRESNNSMALLVDGGTKTNNDWWPLFGYLITYSFMSSPLKMTTEQKLTLLKENIITSLPSMMLIPNFDHDTRNSLLSGIAACILDELADWIVLDSLALGEEVEEVSAVARMNEEVRNRYRANVDQIVDLLLVDG